MKKYLLIIIAILPLFLFMSCPDNEKNEPIELEIYETYCTSIELKITMLDSLKEKEYSVKQNDSLIATGTMTDNQIIITDENLEPNTQYTYKAYSKNDESEMLSVTTMNTTSHDFTWKIDTLGNYGSSLRDVAIISEDDIWVVGEIRINDTINYNAAHWNGEEWELKLITIEPFFSKGTSIHIFKENDIWIGTDIPFHWNGSEWKGYLSIDGWQNGWNFDGWINSIWGSSLEDIYFAGRNGDIVHYDGSDFTKLETGLEIEGDFIDMDGTADGEKVFVVIFQYWHAPHKQVVFQIENNVVSTLFYSDDDTTDYGGYKGPIAVKVIDDYAYIKVHYNIWKHNWNYENNEFINIEDDCSGHNGMKKLEGNDHNDLFGISSKGWFMHYNGIDWNTEYNLNAYNYYFYNLAVKGNLAIMVGCTNGYQGLIVRRNRN